MKSSSPTHEREQSNTHTRLLVGRSKSFRRNPSARSKLRRAQRWRRPLLLTEQRTGTQVSSSTTC